METLQRPQSPKALEAATRKLLTSAGLIGKLNELSIKEMEQGKTKMNIALFILNGGKETVKEFLWFFYTAAIMEIEYADYSIEVDNTPVDLPIVCIYKL